MRELLKEKLRDMQSYNSSWEYTKARSTYHFDKERKDNPGDYYHVVGRFNNIWQDDLDAIVEASRPMNWENRKNSFRHKGVVSLMLKQEEHDIEVGGGDPKMSIVNVMDNFELFPGLDKLINFFGLEKVQPRLHIQKTGQVFNYHIDKLDDLYLGEPFDRIMRFAIMLADWEPGHFYQYGNDVYDRWKAGDVHYFDWPNVPHGTANASSHPRYTLQVTGLRTEATDRLLANKEFQYFNV